VSPGPIVDLEARLPADGGQRIAGTVVAWSSEQLPDFGAAAAPDGHRTTMWSSAPSLGEREEWVRIELRAATPADRVRVWSADGFASLFPPRIDVRVSPDALSWTTVLGHEGGPSSTDAPIEGEFPVTPIRYVELVARELAAFDNGYHYAVVAEVEALTARAAPGTVVVTWTAPGDDDARGRASAYDLRVSPCPFDAATATTPPDRGAGHRRQPGATGRHGARLGDLVRCLAYLG
jgi:hypothetical protein